MTAGQLMTRKFQTVHADSRLEDVERKLQSSGMNLLPVCRDGDFVGTITHEDIAGAPTSRLRVADVIAPDILFCFEGTDVVEAASLMRENRVDLLPVLNRQKALVGVLALASIPGERTARAAEGEKV